MIRVWLAPHQTVVKNDRLRVAPDGTFLRTHETDPETVAVAAESITAAAERA